MPDDLDRARVEALAARLMAEIQPELAKYPLSREHVFVVLNALAFVAATVLAGTDRNARRFFDKAVGENITILRRDPPTADPLGHA